MEDSNANSTPEHHYAVAYLIQRNSDMSSLLNVNFLDFNKLSKHFRDLNNEDAILQLG
jgi:hypothetical protein